jgi:hypothetical protein
MNNDINDTNMNMNMNITLDELKKLLIERQRKVAELTHESKGYVSTLKKINKAIDEQKEELINIIIRLGDSLVDVDNLDRYTNNEEDFSSKLETIEKKLRKIKSSLANLIKNG